MPRLSTRRQRTGGAGTEADDATRPAGPGLPPASPVDVHLIGASYSGSTFLGGLLAANFGAAYLGETAHLPGFVEKYRLFDRPLGCLWCAGRDVPCPVWTPEVIAEVEAAGPPGATSVMRRVTGSAVQVDGSKWPEWFRLAREGRPDGAAPLVAVITARSPLRYVLSASAATGAPVWEAAQWWRDVFADSLRSASRFSVPALVVRNEELRRDPHRVIGALATLLGLPMPAERREPEPTHALGGNIWVQFGYNRETQRILNRLDNVDQGRGAIDDDTWRAVNASQTTIRAHHPRGKAALLEFADAVYECPGLLAVAEGLGYRPAHDLDDFLEECAGGGTPE